MFCRQHCLIAGSGEWQKQVGRRAGMWEEMRMNRASLKYRFLTALPISTGFPDAAGRYPED